MVVENSLCLIGQFSINRQVRLPERAELARIGPIQGGPGSFLANSINDSIRNDSSPAGSMGVSKRFLININSLACDSISDLDSSFKLDSIACVSIRGSIR